MLNKSNERTKPAKRSLFVSDPSRSDRDQRSRNLLKFKMNLETNLQMLDKVNKYADHEINFQNLLYIKKARPHSG